MKHLTLFILATTLVLLAGCADTKKDIPGPVSGGPIVHPAGFADPSTAGFHGKVIQAAGGNVQQCLTCHGSNYGGGTAGVSCISCHEAKNVSLHGPGWINPASPNFHGNFFKGTGHWDMRPCQECHGVQYDGGKVGVSCRTCHTSDGGPENCATCHGNSTNPAPPTDLRGNTATTFPGVGAHQEHLTGGDLSATLVPCSGCHTVPVSTYAPGHIDTSGHAEVVIRSTLASLRSGGITPVPTYTPANLKCNNTYCHGTWRLPKRGAPSDFMFTDTVMLGGMYAPVWNGDSTQAACGTTCHALPPPGHTVVPISVCSVCHGDVVDVNGNIIDKSKHINGKVNVTINGVDMEYNFR